MRLTVEKRPRRLGLTPMIDVVFLLLVFFMLAARFGVDGLLTLTPAGGDGAKYRGAPRLVEIGAEGQLSLNGQPIAIDALPGALAPLMTRQEDLIVLRPGKGAETQALIDVIERLDAAGLTSLAIAE